jgi:hypothetical protein
MVKIWSYFHKSIWVAILFVSQFLCFKNIFFESFRWGIIPKNFVSFPFRTSKLTNEISYIKYKFSHRLGKVCRWLNMYYSKIKIITFKKKKQTMSIWIILKQIVWTYKECNFCRYWNNQSCIHPLYTIPLSCTIIGHIIVSPLAPIIYAFGVIKYGCWKGSFCITSITFG